MPVGAAAGTPQYSGTFVPELWSSTLLVKFYDACVMASISNTDYTGEIKNVGDTVNIRTVPTIIVRDYTKGQDLVIEWPESPNVTLTIDYAKYFNFICDDIDKHQTDIALMDSWSNDASEQMEITTETDIFADIYADADSDNSGTTAGRISQNIDLGATGDAYGLTKSTILDKIVDCKTVLGEQSVPASDRWIIIPEWMGGMIMKSDLKDASLAGDATSIMRNGRLGKIADMTLYGSNLLYSVTDTHTCFHVLFGQKKALSFAAQMTKMESLRAESTFGTLVRGLNVFGWETLKTEALCDLYIRKSS